MNGVQAEGNSIVVIEQTTIAGMATCIDVSTDTGMVSTVVAKRSRLYNCSEAGVYPGDTHGTSFVELIDSVVEYCGIGLRAGAGSTSRIERAWFSHNATGIDSTSGGIVESAQNNVIRGNGTDGAPTTTFALQ